MSKSDFFFLEGLDFGTGRIGDILDAVEAASGQLPAKLKPELLLSALLLNVGLSASEFDDLIATHSPVLRSVKGHAFETFFDDVITEAGFESIEVGGDTSIDRVVNGHSLQLKTPTKAGTSGRVVQYKSHKTHGAKSEAESMNYYSLKEHFADFLVGLVAYTPQHILFIAKEELPTVPTSPSHILSPFKVDWLSHPGLDAWHRIGVTPAPVIESTKVGKSLLPKSSQAVELDGSILVRTIANRQNFRIWDMAIRGFAREVAFVKHLNKIRVPHFPTAGQRTTRADKADICLGTRSAPVFVQMKGISTNNCNLNAPDPVIAIETQLTRGRVNDHPTQSRLYLQSDFDYLAIALDPAVAFKCDEVVGARKNLDWKFFLVPTSDLKPHPDMPHRLKSLQTFTYSQLMQFQISTRDDVPFRALP